MERSYSDLLIRLATGVSQRRMYFDNHPRVVESCRDVSAELTQFLRRTGAEAFEIGVHNSKFVRDGCYLVGPSIAGRALIDFAERLGCGGFAFRLPLEPRHLTSFFRLGATRFEPLSDLVAAQALFERNGIGHLGLLPKLSEGGNESDVDGVGEDASEWLEYVTTEFSPLVRVYQSMYEVVAGSTLAASQSGAVNLDEARQAGHQLVGLSDQRALDVMQFLRYPDYDSYTIGHSVRVAALSAMLGRRLGWSEDVLATLATAGLLHDLGKGRIPPEILFKPGRLDDEERRVIETHPALGAHLLLDNGETDAVVISAAWGHHLKHEGGGYPAMPDSRYRPGIVAEVIHVCDVFEALTARRPYKRSLPPRQAYEIMLKDAGAYHPHVLSQFISVMGLYPPGSQVRLGDGSLGVVVAKGAALDRPRVRLTSDAHGLPIPRDHQHLIDLHEHAELTIVELVSVGTGVGETVDC
jgi:HD-GYP domain-containing protein (c-di-GMP phosphodiesterase class II)